jgi:phage host-nuclease inhibitor protein Gam
MRTLADELSYAVAKYEASGSDGDFFRALRKQGQYDRSINRQNGAMRLIDNGIEFHVKNNGAHLIVNHNNKIVDFWPGTGKWIVRNSSIKRKGIINLINFLKNLD